MHRLFTGIAPLRRTPFFGAGPGRNCAWRMRLNQRQGAATQRGGRRNQSNLTAEIAKSTEMEGVLFAVFGFFAVMLPSVFCVRATKAI
jgi:hypothetical protein